VPPGEDHVKRSKRKLTAAYKSELLWH